MNRTPSFVSFFIAALVAVAVSIISCGESPSEVDAASPAVQATKIEKTAERLIERSIERWKLVVGAQEESSKWIDVYGFELPENKRRMPLEIFLEGKEKFHYDAPTTPSVLLIDGDDAYVQVDCTWLAYMHPVIAKNNPGHQELMEMLEIWRWREGDWYRDGSPEERSEFFKEHVDIAQKVDAYLAGN